MTTHRSRTRLPRWGTLIDCLMLAAALAMVLLLVSLAGCTPKTESQFSGRSVTEAQLRFEHEQERRRIAEEMREEAERLQAEQRRRKIEFETAVARLDAESRLQIAELQARFEVESEETRVTLAAIEQRHARAMESADAKLRVGVEEIQAKAAMWDQGLGLGLGALQESGVAGMIPGGSLLLNAALGWYAMRKRGQAGTAETQARSMAEREREAREQLLQRVAEMERQVREAADKAWDDAESRTLRLLAPPPQPASA